MDAFDERRRHFSTYVTALLHASNSTRGAVVIWMAPGHPHVRKKNSCHNCERRTNIHSTVPFVLCFRIPICRPLWTPLIGIIRDPTGFINEILTLVVGTERSALWTTIYGHVHTPWSSPMKKKKKTRDFFLSIQCFFSLLSEEGF